ncbi:MAG: hypothetical protein M3024_15140 [Candidatus Dormibacteraeota bacterium]|nr:hypothetical protein [Candidatus Dormibacteraeota bacterium]
MARIVWDDDNRRHLLLDRAARWISEADVEQVLTSAASTRKRSRRGRLQVTGRTAAGRRLTVIVERPAPGLLRPIMAWETP